MTNIHAVSTTLRTIPASLDLTQEQLADRLGVSFASVNRREGGVNMPQKAAWAANEAPAAEAGIAADSASSEIESAVRVNRHRTRCNRRAALPSTKPMEQTLWDAECFPAGLPVKSERGKLPWVEPRSGE